MDGADSVIGLIESNNPLADGAIPTYMARASGEVGNLSEPDKAPFGGSKALMEKVKQVYSNATAGKLTPENRDFVRRLAVTMKENGIRNKNGYAKKVSQQYGKIGSYGTADEIYSILNQDLGVNPDDAPKGVKFPVTNDGGQELTEPNQHNQALDWANANPNDPRSAAIKQKAIQSMQG